jgi:hypothetical protein
MSRLTDFRLGSFKPANREDQTTSALNRRHAVLECVGAKEHRARSSHEQGISRPAGFEPTAELWTPQNEVESKVLEALWGRVDVPRNGVTLPHTNKVYVESKTLRRKEREDRVAAALSAKAPPKTIHRLQDARGRTRTSECRLVEPVPWPLGDASERKNYFPATRTRSRAGGFDGMTPCFAAMWSNTKLIAAARTASFSSPASTKL